MVSGDNPTRDESMLIGELEKWGRALAEQRGLDVARVLRIVRRGFELSERHGEGMAHSVFAQLQAALDLLPPERTLEIFEREDLVGLIARVSYPAHLVDADTPSYTFAEFAELLVQFRQFLRQHQAIILAEGQAPVRFTESRWLDRRLSRLYYRRIPATKAPEGARGEDPHELDIWRLRESRGERDHDQNTGQLRLDPADATRLVGGRPKMLDLKLNLLARLEYALRRSSREQLWSDCLDLMNQALTAEEVTFYLRMDRFYRGEDAGKDGLWDEPSPIRAATLPGGFSDILEVFGHCECELQHRVMDETKRELLALAQEFRQPDWRAVLGRTYFEVLDHPWRPQLDEVLDRYVERQIIVAYSDYWSEFRDRLVDAFQNKWIWAPPDWSATRRGLERVLARIQGCHGTTTGAAAETPDVVAAVPSDAGQVPQSVIENIFTREEEFWCIRFSGTEKRVPHLKGMQYIGYLLERPYQPVDVIELVQAIEPPEAIGLGRGGVEMTPGQAAAAGITGDAFGRGGRMIGPKTREGQGDEEHMRGPRDKGRDAVKGAVGRAKARIKTAHPTLYDHLTASLTIGNRCSYDPAERILWNRPGVKSTSRSRPT